MSTQRMSFNEFTRRLGEAMPLNAIGPVFQVSPVQIRRAVASKQLPVFTFRSDDGRVFRLVRLRDAKLVFKGNPLTAKGMARALMRMIQQDSPSQIRRRQLAADKERGMIR